MDQQPPPNAPAPPPSETALKSRRSYHVIWGVGIASLLLFLVVGLLSPPTVLRSRKNADRTEAVNNAREIHKALFEFDVEYGEFPSASTIPKVQSETSTTMPLGTASSNDYFRQLLANGLGNEGTFYSGSRSEVCHALMPDISFPMSDKNV